MNKLFITLYDFFERRRALLCTVLAVLVAAMGAAALQLRFSEASSPTGSGRPRRHSRT